MSEREVAVARVRSYISDGGYRAGDRLPAERELTRALDMGRSLLRRALETLERDGTIWRHVGKGTFIATEPGRGSLSDLASRVSPVHMMRARLSLEPAIAREAAINASDDNAIRLRLAMEKAQAATDWDEYETRDDAFHRTVAEATNNALLLALFDQLNQVRRAVAWNTVVRGTPRPSPDHNSFAEHRQITEAIETRDAPAAHAAMRDHLASVSARLFGET